MRSHEGQPSELAERVAQEVNGRLYPRSTQQIDDAVIFILRRASQKLLAVLAPAGHSLLRRLESIEAEPVADGEGLIVALCPLSPPNAAIMRESVAWLRPVRLGIHPSVGFGDRLGLATPAHARALESCWEGSAAGGMLPIFAQQSIRENSRTRRTPQEVIDDAMWGVLEAGWTHGYGADADHLKTPADIDVTVAAGYTFFTIDPGDFVEGNVHALDPKTLQERVNTLPWDELEDSLDDLTRRYLSAALDIGGKSLSFTPETLSVAAVKYGRAVAHTARMYRYLKGRASSKSWELEVSVDETDSPTSHLEHYYIASELNRLGVEWVSLAPRFVGRFEKGVDYQGADGGLSESDLAEFQRDFAGHAAIAKSLGPYKISLHSGSDKFSIYPIAADLTDGLVHLKTAGTSYLEALRTVARVNPDLFREIYRFAIERYPEDKHSYHVSAEAYRMPSPESVDSSTLEYVLDHFDARQALHVTFGSVLNATNVDGQLRFKPALLDTLAQHEDEHYNIIEAHFVRHLMPFAR